MPVKRTPAILLWINGQEKGVRWDKSKFPIDFYIHESVPSEAGRNFISAVDHWNMAWEDYLVNQGLEPFQLFNVADKEMRYSGSPGNDKYNMLFFVKENFSQYLVGDTSQSSSSAVQAITAMISTPRVGDIQDTDIIVNAQNYKYFFDEKYNGEIMAAKREAEENRRLASLRPESFWQSLKQKIQRWFKFLIRPFQKKKAIRQVASPSVKVPRGHVDFPSLMIHEAGHVPGLGHFDASDETYNSGHLISKRKRRKSSSNSFVSVMEPKLANGRVRRAIKEYDLNNLFCGYFDY